MFTLVHLSHAIERASNPAVVFDTPHDLNMAVVADGGKGKGKGEDNGPASTNITGKGDAEVAKGAGKDSKGKDRSHPFGGTSRRSDDDKYNAD